ncbi:MAG TPA: hypothetical protein VFI23_05595 [Rhizomicrobium sp.]|nr:hypothetical protein [Rhizomicrobium sp.]
MAWGLAILWRIARELIVPLAIILTGATLCSFFRNSDVLYFTAAALLLAVWLFVLGSRIAARTAEQGWPSALPLIAVIALTLLLARPVMKAGDYVHLAMVYSQLSDQVRAAHGNRLSVDWGNDGFPGYGSTDYFLVHDPSGKVMSETELETDSDRKFSVGVRRLIGDFYLRAVYYP